jgi:prepilin-type N-terminal cleavage/methylation domain-containing protein/prepilin-type processing-associated H-X9-DG protein
LRSRDPHHPPRAFTLIELLVVIGIIALLMSILLPALRRARAAADSVACLANLRGIGQAMTTYAQQHGGAIPGSPHTTAWGMWWNTGSFSLKPGVDIHHVPGDAVALYDFVGPLARIMGLDVPDTIDAVPRIRAYRQLKPFQCPANSDVIATKFYGPVDMEDGPMLSYGTGLAFMLAPFKSGFQGRTTMLSPTSYWTAPANYIPRTDKVGNLSEKIYCADSGRWSRYDSAPTFSTDVDGDHNSTMFGDFGPFWLISKSYDRSYANKIKAATIDGRIYAYRHGERRPFKKSGAYRMNAVFFDGHAETLDDMASADPKLWLPRGTMIDDPDDKDGGMYPDVRERYLKGVDKTHPYVAP